MVVQNRVALYLADIQFNSKMAWRSNRAQCICMQLGCANASQQQGPTSVQHVTQQVQSVSIIAQSARSKSTDEGWTQVKKRTGWKTTPA